MSGPTTPRLPDGDAAQPRVTAVHLLAVATAVLGAAMIVRALTAGGGVGSYGVLIGALFLAAGLLRLRLLAARSRAR